MAIPPNAQNLPREDEKQIFIQWAQFTIITCFGVKSEEDGKPLSRKNPNAAIFADKSLQAAHNLYDESVRECEQQDSLPIRVLFGRKVLDYCAVYRSTPNPAA